MEWVRATVEEIVQETPLDRRFRLRLAPEAAAGFHFVPGQHVVLKLPRPPGGPPGALSLCSAPEELPLLDLTVRNRGHFGRRFSTVPAGVALELTRPRGRFDLRAEAGLSLVLLAGGSGVTPYRSLIRHLRRAGHDAPVALVVSARSPTELPFHREMKEHAAAAPWFRYVPTVTREAGGGWAGRIGRVEGLLLESLVPDPAAVVVCACGPSQFVEVGREAARALGVPEHRIRHERWG